MSREMQAYLSYIVNDLLTSESGILMSDVIDTDDETYQAWRTEETINIYTFLNYAIAQNWVDTSVLTDYLDGSKEYSEAEETYGAMKAYILESLKENHSFDKLIYEYMIRSGALTGRQICMMVYEQGVLEFDEDQYNRLASGSLGAYDFLRGKIQTLEITPGQLGLEPCTGSRS